jgi:outer membrane biosynthesis protein TonB
VPVDASGVGRWSYNCWSLYGQIGGGEVEDADHDAATPTATPRPPATPTSQPTPDPCPTAESVDGVISAVELFKECPTPSAPAAPPPPDTPTPCPPSSGGYDPAGGLASGGPGC